MSQDTFAPARAVTPAQGTLTPASATVAPARGARNIVRGAVAIVWLDLFAYLGQAGAISGFEHGRRELMLGLALAALAATAAASAIRARATIGAASRASRRWPGSVHLCLAACMLAPALYLARPGLAALRPTGVAVLDAFLIALLPASALFWAWHGSRITVGGFCCGMTVGYALTECVLLPSLGWIATLCLWAIVWVACEARVAGAGSEAEPPTRSARAAALFAVAWGIVAGAAAVSARPVVFQHVSGTRVGVCALVAVALLGLWAGAWLGLALRRVWNTRWLALVGAALTGVALWTGLRNLMLHGEPVAAESIGPFAFSWRAVQQGWFYLGFPAVALGACFACLDPRGSRVGALVLAGTCAGAWLGETLLLPRWFEPGGGAPSPLFALAQPMSAANVDAVAWNPDGIAARYRTIAGLEPSDSLHWQAQRWERDPSWKRIEQAELLLPRRAAPNARELWIVGHPGPVHGALLAGVERVHMLDPLPGTDGGGDARGVNPNAMLWAEKSAEACVVLLAHPREPSCFSLRATSTVVRALEADVVSRGGSLWIWCDPRALTPAGIARALAGWASEFPHARLYVLQDGYAGPLFGLQLGGEAAHRVALGGEAAHRVALGGEAALGLDAELEQVVVLVAPVSDCLAAGARAPSLNWPALEWRAATRSSPFPVPDGEVLDAAAALLTTPASRPAGRLLEVLALHAHAQVDRHSFHTKWDRVRIEPREIDAARALLRERPDFEPIARYVGNLAQVLFEKREYDFLFELLNDALELRPDVALFHHLLGRVRNELLDAEGAVAEYELALALDPGSSTIKSELAHIHAKRGRWQLAVPLLEEVWRATTPPDPLIAKALGLGYLELGKPAEARTLLEFAWQQSPGDGDIRRALERLDADKH